MEITNYQKYKRRTSMCNIQKENHSAIHLEIFITKDILYTVLAISQTK